jgi:hypothetical protein
MMGGMGADVLHRRAYVDARSAARMTLYRGARELAERWAREDVKAVLTEEQIEHWFYDGARPDEWADRRTIDTWCDEGDTIGLSEFLPEHQDDKASKEDRDLLWDYYRPEYNGALALAIKMIKKRYDKEVTPLFEAAGEDDDRLEKASEAGCELLADVALKVAKEITYE